MNNIAPSDRAGSARHDDVSADDFRGALGRYATGVTVVTTLTPDGVPVGVTATSFASLSLDPPLVQWSLRIAAQSHPVFHGADRFAISILAADQSDVSDRFSANVADRFDGAAVRPGLGGVPLIEGAMVWLECAVEDRLPGGDHTIFVGRVQRARTFDKQPLLHWCGDYKTLSAADHSN